MDRYVILQIPEKQNTGSPLPFVHYGDQMCGGQPDQVPTGGVVSVSVEPWNLTSNHLVGYGMMVHPDL